jgi:hypothetical protein
VFCTNIPPPPTPSVTLNTSLIGPMSAPRRGVMTYCGQFRGSHTASLSFRPTGPWR